ncbi:MULTISPECIES: hypothetical protein [unclassified Flavobacterium]|jgi:hypothetical protein|uniref:hypothetical protein n=1 Tax=unclassified Flavobacterium TaxID=196869 RepID=UPI0025C6E009|nr:MULTISPECIES: hypothetical protein [unclassified Flavobacterium]
MKSFIFWQRWLFYSSLVFAFFGIVFALYGNNPFFMPYNKALAHIFRFGDQIPSEIAFKAFIWGSLGGNHSLLLYFAGLYRMVPVPEERTLGPKCNYRSIWSMGLIGFGCLPLLWSIFSGIYH